MDPEKVLKASDFLKFKLKFLWICENDCKSWSDYTLEVCKYHKRLSQFSKCKLRLSSSYKLKVTE